MLRIFKKVALLPLLISVFGVGLFFVLVGMAQESVYAEKFIVVQGGMLSSISADAVYVFDFASQTEIFARNAEEVNPIASVTKLVSSALFLEFASSTAIATIAWSDVNTDGRSGRLQAGQQYTNKELLFPVLLESSNDAAVAMGRVALVDLVQEMNIYAQQKQLLNTRFTDTSGLDDGNVSTAYELGQLVTALYREYPYVFDITRLKTYLNHVNAWMNNNPFVRDPGYKGGKHGYTYAANRTAVAFFDEELKSGQVRTIVYVLLGSNSLQTDMKNLRTFVQDSVIYE